MRISGRIRLLWEYSRGGFVLIMRCVRRTVLARIPFCAIGWGAQAAWLARSAFIGRFRAIGIARYEAGQVEVGLACRDALRTMSGGVLEAWLDKRLYAGRECGLDSWPDLQRVARELGNLVRQIKARDPGRLVILSPFHYLSQYANIYVVDEVRKILGLDSISVVSGVPRDMYGDDSLMIPAVRVLHTQDEGGAESRNSLGLRVVRALKRDGAAVLFADVPPFTLAKFPMETVAVSMEGREARVHRGVFRLGAPLNAVLLPFYLKLEHGRFSVRHFEPIVLAHPEAPQHLANCIVTAREENYPHWLYAGHPCGYHFAPSR